MAKTKKTSEEVIPKKNTKEIVIKETEDDVVFGGNFLGNPNEFKDEIKKEAEKGAVFAKFVLPTLVFLLIGGVVGIGTWYYAKPEHAAVQSTEDKIQTPPQVTEPVEEVPAASPTTPVTPATPAPAPTTSSTYTVQEGDTMSGIANKYGMTSQELANYNNLTDVNALQIGQVLKVPVK
jgi:LysM repeat protein